jgi:hypothetical protein
MRRPIAVVGVTSLTLGALALAIFGLGDRATVVPAPEAVAEGLLRQLQAHRYSRTEQFLSTAAGPTWSPHRLRAWWRDLEVDIGSIDQIQGQSHVTAGTMAEAVVRVRGSRRTATVRIPMQREWGLWVVTGMPRPASRRSGRWIINS